jgi:small subunit ribosomal protein S6
VKSAERMGKRRLAYNVRKFNDGFYILLTVDADGKSIHEIERRLRVSEPVIKFLSVRVDEEQKRLDKIKQLRSTRVKRSTAESAPAPAPEAAPAPAATA